MLEFSSSSPLRHIVASPCYVALPHPSIVALLAPTFAPLARFELTTNSLEESGAARTIRQLGIILPISITITETSQHTTNTFTNENLFVLIIL